jgi:cobalt-zinc-cadmium efflux system outer membrane protein
MVGDTPAGLLPAKAQGEPRSGVADSGAAPRASSSSLDPKTADATKAPGQASEMLPNPIPTERSGLTLDQAILECLQSDPKLRAGWEAITQANADLLTSSLIPNPTLTVDGIFLPLRRFTPDRPGGPPQVDVIVAYPIDWFLFGKRAAAITNARLGVDVSAADYADVVRQRLAAVVAGFYDVLEAQALLDLARQDRDSLKRVEGITAQRVKLGGVGNVELDRVRVSVLDSQREVRSRETALAAAKSKLRALVGRGEASSPIDANGNLAVPAPAKPLNAEEAVAVAEQNRPDIISLRRQIAKAGSALRVEQTKAAPSIGPTFALSRQFQQSIGFADAPSYDVSLVMSLPLFDRNQGNIAKAESALSQSNLNLRAQVLQLRAEVEQAANTFRAAYVNVTANDPEQLRVARDVRDKIEAAYKAGGRTLLEVLDAQRSYRDTYRTYIMGQSTYWHSLHQLNAAMGKQLLR